TDPFSPNAVATLWHTEQKDSLSFCNIKYRFLKKHPTFNIYHNTLSINLLRFYESKKTFQGKKYVYKVGESGEKILTFEN
ncbi:MAG: hypothetical protein IIW61_03815, partial [Bacteroidaceae bacterium]|nr:hypothetical protein [Bacteroidaceae bacterium]